MANQNVTQLIQQTGSADASSLFYAVTNGITDTGLPLSVFVHNLGLTGTPTSPTAVVGTNTTQIASTAFVQSQLTTSLAPYALLASPTFTGTVTLPTVTVNGVLSSTNTTNSTNSSTGSIVTAGGLGVALDIFCGGTYHGSIITSAGTIDNIPVGATTPNTGSFTTLAASSTVSGAGFTARFASPGPIGNTAASTGAFTTLSASSTVSGTGFSTYLASPPPLGSTAANTGAFTTLSASSTVSGTGFSTYLASPPAIGGTAAAAGSFTNLSSSGTVSGTGFSNYLLSPPAIGTTTPAAGKFTTLQATSTITPATTSGIVGTTLADNASAGSIGEFITASASGVALTNATAANVTSISLTAGDWDVWGALLLTSGVSTVGTAVLGAINTTSATLPTTPLYFQLTIAMGASQAWSAPPPMQRINVSTTTTVFLVAEAVFSAGSVSATGTIYARRRR